MGERLFRSDIVVYGKEVHHIERNDSTVENGPVTVLDSQFDVLCVLKGDNQTINNTILIEQVHPRSTCSGTYGKVDINSRIIVGLKRTKSRNYAWHEVNVIQSAAFMATEPTFEMAVDVCGLENWVPPMNGDAKNCPEYSRNEPCNSFTDTDDGISLIVKLSTVLLCVVSSILSTY